jgi:hypothetical protein
MAFLLEPSHHNACGYAYLSRELLDIFSTEVARVFVDSVIWMRYRFFG